MSDVCYYCKLCILSTIFSDNLSISSLIRSHRVRKLPVETDNYQRIIVRRKKLFEDALHHFQHYFDETKYVRITYQNDPAIDNGGPKREFFYLLLREIASKNSIFCGPDDSRCVAHNMVELDKKTYYHVGKMMALSIIYGGPAPKFFAPSVANYIAFGDKSTPSYLDIPDASIKEKLVKVRI